MHAQKTTSISPAKLAANRRNARKSTGPKTPQGRAISKMNALKHGILSKAAVVRGRCLKEDDREFAALHQRLCADLKPVGLLEEMLVDQIVTAHWRLRRALKAETGEIALNVDAGQWDRKHQNPVLDRQRWEAHGDPVYDMENSVLGNFIIGNKLKQIRSLVEQEGELNEAAVRLAYFHGEPNRLSEELEKYVQGGSRIPKVWNCRRCVADSKRRSWLILTNVWSSFHGTILNVRSMKTGLRRRGRRRRCCHPPRCWIKSCVMRRSWSVSYIVP